MFHRILVPFDETERSQQSLLLAERLAKQFDASILLVRVRPILEAGKDIAADLRILNAWAEEVRAGGIVCDTILDLDHTVDGILATAKYQGNDLIVMAPHHRTWLEALRHPSVTEELMAQSPAPLLIWPEKMTREAVTSFLESPASVIIVPLDGSELAEQALPYAEDLAARYGRGLILVRVTPPTDVTPTMSQMGQLESDLRATEYAEAGAYLHELRERLKQGVRVPVQSMILTGIPATELLRLVEAHPDAVLVMTTHGRGRASRTFLGSVAAKLARHATNPLFILRPGVGNQQPSTRSEDALAASK